MGLGLVVVGLGRRIRLMVRTRRKTQRATKRKLTVFWIKLPYVMTAAVSFPKRLGIVRESLVKSKPPASRLTRGIIRSLTREVTMAVKEPPTATPTAKSRTLPRSINSLNSLTKLESCLGLFVDLVIFCVIK